MPAKSERGKFEEAKEAAKVKYLAASERADAVRAAACMNARLVYHSERQAAWDAFQQALSDTIGKPPVATS